MTKRAPRSTADAAGRSSEHGRLALAAWCLYDWANSAFSTVIVTFVFSAYFTRAVAESPAEGTALWGRALTVAALIAAISSPFLGAIADLLGRRKPWLGAFTVVSIVATAMLWFTRPSPEWTMWALVWFVIAGSAFDAAFVFYNAMLPALVPREQLGRASGWAWGLGYAGGLACLLLALAALVHPEGPWIALDNEQAEPARATALLVAAWFAVFALPLFLLTTDRPSTGISVRTATVLGLGSLRGLLARLGELGHVGRFLVARMFYTDGLATLFAFGGIFASGTFDMELDEIVRFGIALNVTAGLGAAGFAWIDDWIGPKATVVISLAALTVISAAITGVESADVFWWMAVSGGLFVGPAQAASRSFMAHLIPPRLEGEMFGLFALSGKVTAFVGPWLVATLTAAFESQRAGMAAIPLLLSAGLVVLLFVPAPPAARA